MIRGKRFIGAVTCSAVLGLSTLGFTTLGAITAGPASASPADVDTAFGANGVATVPGTAGALSDLSAAAVDAADNIVVAGVTQAPTDPHLATLLVGRLGPSGAPDPSFGNAGTVAVSISAEASGKGGNQNTERSLFVASGPGRTTVVAADVIGVDSKGNETTGEALVLRFTSAGGLDSTFGSGGIVTLPAESFVEGIAVDGGGNVFVTGMTSGSAAALGVERLTAQGKPDTTFGTAGVVQFPRATDVKAVAVTSDGHVLVGGTADLAPTLWRLTATGALDSAFGTGGVAVPMLGSVAGSKTPSLLLGFPILESLLPQADGSVIAVGQESLTSTGVVLELTATGALDPAFGLGGSTSVDLPPGITEIRGAEAADGGIVIGGLGGPTSAWVGRLTPTGIPDRTFAPTGKVAPVLAGGSAGVFSAPTGPLVQSTGKVVIGGEITLTGGSTSLSAARLLGGSGPVIPKPATVTRLAGTDRIGTAVAVSQATFSAPTQVDQTRPRADRVVLASADNFPDAIVAVPLAEKVSPLLLTHTAALDPRVQAEIIRVLGPAGRGGTVSIVGGTAAVSTAVQQAINALGYTTERLAGTDRFFTAQAVANRISPSVLLEATGTDFPDALAAGVAAAQGHGAVLLTHGSQPSTFPVGSGTRYAVGGAAAAADPDAVPIVGNDRYATAAMVAQTFFLTPSGVGVATGASFADALSGGSRAAALSQPLLLTGPTAVPTQTMSYLQSRAQWINNVDIFGGTAAISDAVAGELRQAIGG
jgi:uncharacterized delta-60 repeat protein